MSRYIGAGQNDWFDVRIQKLVSKVQNPGGFLKTFAHKNIHKLQNHKMAHTGEKAHKCYQCLPCVHAPSFKIQMRTHMGEMSYKCSQYNYTCTRVTNLHTHMLTHTEVRAFNCDQCIKYSHEKVIS